MYVGGVGSRSVAAFTADYTPVQGAVYAKACLNFCETLKSSSVKYRRILGIGQKTKLQMHTDQSLVARGEKQTEVAPPKQRGGCTKQFLLCSDDRCIDLGGEDHRASPLQLCEPGVSLAASAERRTVRQVDQFQKVVDSNAESAFDSKDINKSSETEAQARKADAEHEKNVRQAEAYW